eukprot:TRINITY_DN3752_c1_g2_i1.p1 TRINITY_DN3752_c1_g2~~TRINITY_DN3752_c1_g2_i1.p1  ORF type:complete len:357 (+),score=113.29 TRINITY_DN3752_c1_g2_i1:824-1894(+)
MGVSPSPVDNAGRTPVLNAIINDNLEALKCFASKCNEALHDVVGEGGLPLHVACRLGNIGAVKLLLEHGCDPNARDEGGRSSLHVAIGEERRQVITTLLESGKCEVEERDGDGMTPLMMALWANNESGFASAKTLVESGLVNVNAIAGSPGGTEDDGNTYIHLACAENKGDIVRTLCQLGADAFIPNQRKQTAVHIVADTGNMFALDALMKGIQGSEINHQDQNGETPLFVAVKRGHIDVVNRLVSHAPRPDVNILDAGGDSALKMALWENREDIAEILVRSGAMINLSNSKGNSLLHLAAADGREAIIPFLVANGCTLDKPNKTNQTPLHLAAMLGHQEVLVALLDNGASPNVGK